MNFCQGEFLLSLYYRFHYLAFRACRQISSITAASCSIILLYFSIFNYFCNKLKNFSISLLHFAFFWLYLILIISRLFVRLPRFICDSDINQRVFRIFIKNWKIFYHSLDVTMSTTFGLFCFYIILSLDNFHTISDKLYANISLARLLLMKLLNNFRIFTLISYRTADRILFLRNIFSCEKLRNLFTSITSVFQISTD